MFDAPAADDVPFDLTAPAVEVENATVHFNRGPVLRRISLSLPIGTCAAILGPNASGKTTLMAALAGLLSLQRGEIRIFGQPRRQQVETELAIRRRVCYLPATGFGPGGLTVRELWLTVAELYRCDLEESFEQADRLAAVFDLTDKLDAGIGSLSTGQVRKSHIAAALMSQAPLLLLDEPFSGGLDPSGIRALQAILRQLVRERGRTVLFTIPVPDLVEDLADRLLVLADHELIVDDAPAELLRRVPGARTLADALAKLAFPEQDDALSRYVAGDGRP